ncbi:MAG TPA: hypothetical protein VMU16_08245 [Candidatus Binataceae bacterium]|nr:hypothetical protein [Candidatus Binataceae bacterium]
MPFITNENGLITIDGLVFIYSHDVVVLKGALDWTPERLFEAVRLAYWLESDAFMPAVWGAVFSGPAGNVTESRLRNIFG